jgi:hypothetical protein
MKTRTLFFLVRCYSCSVNGFNFFHQVQERTGLKDEISSRYSLNKRFESTFAFRFCGREGVVKFPAACCGNMSPELALGYNTIYFDLFKNGSNPLFNSTILCRDILILLREEKRFPPVLTRTDPFHLLDAVSQGLNLTDHKNKFHY